MYTRIPCRVCGRRLKLPYGADPRKARCPSCGTRVEAANETPPEAPPPSAASEPVQPAAVKVHFPAALLSPGDPPKSEVPIPPQPILHPARLLQPAAPEVLSLEDDDTLLSLDDDDEPASGAKPTSPEPFQGPFPPQRFQARVRSDSHPKLPLAGLLDVVVTSHGLFLEPPGSPFLYVPVGTKGEASGPAELTITLGAREIELRFVNVGNANRLARDVTLLLAGQPILLATSDYHRPGWLSLLALGLAAAVVVGPIMFAQSRSTSMAVGYAIGGGLAILGLSFNLLLLRFTRFSLESKVLLMGGAAVALTACYAIGALVYVRTTPYSVVERASSNEITREDAVEKPPAIPFVEYPAAPAVPPPPSYLDLATEKGHARIEDGPADVTALALIPGRSTLLASYADGTSRHWALDRPTIEDWRPGPTVEGSVKSIRFGDGGKTAIFAGAQGSVIVPLDSPPLAPLRIAGEILAIAPAKAKERDRMAVLRGNRILVKLLPAGLPQKPTGTAINGFTLLTTKQETQDASYRVDLTPPAKLTFLAFHPTGLLMGGQPDGSVITWSQKGPFKVENTTHKSPVRVVLHSPNGTDFALGDDHGLVTLWQNRTLLPTRHAMLTSTVTALALASSSQRLAAGNAAGQITIHDVKPPAEVGTLKVQGAVKALAFGPDDDSLIVAVGRGIEIHMLDSVIKKAPPPSPAPPMKTEAPKTTLPKPEPPKTVVPPKK